VAIRIGYVADWPSRLEGRLYEQFKGKPNFVQFARLVLGRQAQDLEDSLQTLASLPSIEDSEGVNLDVIGKIVGQPRVGVDDPTYRMYLRARVATNKSRGTVPDIYRVFNVLFGDPVEQVIEPGGLASFVERILTPITGAQALVAVGFLHDAKAAGVRANLEWQEDVDAEMFYTAGGVTVALQTSNGDTVLGVHSTKGLPLSGQLVLDPGLAGAETVTYTSIASPVSLNVSAIANVHDVGSFAELVGDPGKGWGDSGNPATGGKYAGAASATY